jgi:hypothetical protein
VLINGGDPSPLVSRIPLFGTIAWPRLRLSKNDVDCGLPVYVADPLT